MARALEFDYADALEQGTLAFWKKGFATTSLRDLLKAMNIGEGSFYNTLKSKKNAYIECLKHYNDAVGGRRAKAFASAPTAALGVRAMFHTILETLENPEEPDICLMAGALSQDIMNDPELASYVAGQFQDWTQQMTQRFVAEKAAGLLPESFDPITVAPVITTYVQGLWRTALLTPDRQELARQMDRFLSAIGL